VNNSENGRLKKVKQKQKQSMKKNKCNETRNAIKKEEMH
jgi:hypothetical protein